MKTIKELNEILASEEKLKSVMRDELKEIKKEYPSARRTVIKDEVSEIVIDELDMVSKEDYVVCVSSSGYIKKIPLKSYSVST